MGWFKNKLRKWLGVPDAALPVPVRKSGFFTTDFAAGVDRNDPKALAAFLRLTQDRSFQRTSRDTAMVSDPLMAVDSLNVARPTVTAIAMDDATWSGLGAAGAYGFGNYGGVPPLLVDWYAAQGFIGYQMCAILAQHWFVDKACSMPAKDAVRNGYEITVNDGTKIPPKVLAEMKRLDKVFKVKKNVVEAIRHRNIYGVRVIIFKVNSEDPDYYTKPFNPDGVTAGSYKGMAQVDPYWITPELDMDAAANPASIHFYEPTYWRVNGVRYHRSHLVVLRTCDPPDVLKPTYFYGGIPLPQRIYERVYAAERTANEAPQMALTKRSTVVHMDLESAAANEDAVIKRLNLWSWMRDNYGVKVAGVDENIEQFDTALADFDMLIMTQYQIACAIAEVPATKMMGTQPKGFNATGEFDEASYHESLESLQENDATEIVNRHHLLCIRSYIVPKFGIKPFQSEVVWNDLDAETAGEKSKRRLDDSTAAKNYYDTGAVDGQDVRDRLIADEESGWNGLSAAAPEPEAPPVVMGPDGKPMPNPDAGGPPKPAGASATDPAKPASHNNPFGGKEPPPTPPPAPADKPEVKAA